ncbi:MAG: sialate O-acetylesterase, partial [Flavisolibacter sp.]|nr:sialate O-acetylesterase [Flavisolibacter sp.]
MRSKTFIILLFLLATQTIIHAQVRLPKILGNNMVLQREKPVPIWGWAAPGQQITVSFAGQQQTAKVDADSSWKVVLSPLKANDQPQDMTITTGNTIKLSNILVGEVWLCSGQSNM